MSSAKRNGTALTYFSLLPSPLPPDSTNDPSLNGSDQMVLAPILGNPGASEEGGFGGMTTLGTNLSRELRKTRVFHFASIGST